MREEISMGVLAAVMVPHPPLIIPEVGRGEEEKIKNTINGFTEASELIRGVQPETVVIISPHSAFYSDYFHISPGGSAMGSFGKFGARDVRIEAEYDVELVSALCSRASEEGVSAGTAGERDKDLDHGTLVPLYFLRKAYGGELPVQIVRIGLSGLTLSEHYRLGMLIKKTSEELGRPLCVIASGDLSHVLKKDGPYGFRAEGPEYDNRIMDIMSRASFGELFDFSDQFLEGAAECGHRSFAIMAGCFDGVSVSSEMLSYEGPFGVGYGVCTFLPGDPDRDRRFLLPHGIGGTEEANGYAAGESPYVVLARTVIEEYVLTGKKAAVPNNFPNEALTKKAGVFVSLKKHGELRGCIGTISATEDSIAKEIIRNAISASTQDPRFPPVRPDELPALVYSVDVLGDKEEISSPEELDVKRYGVIVSSGGRRGLLLPNLEGVDTVREQIEIAMRKAGIRKGERIKLERFEVVRYS